MQFLIEATEDQLQATTVALTAAGVPFDPHENLVSIDTEYDNGEFHCSPVHRGDELAALADGANRYLTENGLTPLLPDPVDMSTMQRSSLLDLLNTQFTWRATDRVNYPWWEADGQAKWEQLLAERPGIFQRPTEGSSEKPAYLISMPATERLLGPTPTAVLSSAMATLYEETTGETESPGQFSDVADQLLARNPAIRDTVARTMQNWQMPQPLMNVIWEETDLAANEMLKSMSKDDRDAVIAALA